MWNNLKFKLELVKKSNFNKDIRKEKPSFIAIQIKKSKIKEKSILMDIIKKRFFINFNILNLDVVEY